MIKAIFIFLLTIGCLEAQGQHWRKDTVFLNGGGFYCGNIMKIIPDSLVVLRTLNDDFTLDVLNVKRLSFDVRYDWVPYRRHGPNKIRAVRLLQKLGK